MCNCSRCDRTCLCVCHPMRDMRVVIEERNKDRENQQMILRGLDK